MRKEKNKKVNIVILIVDIVAICLIILILYFLRSNRLIKFPWDNFVAKAKVVVVRVDEHSMLVQGIEGNGITSEIYQLGFTKKGNIGYEMGQELLVYYDGFMTDMYPGSFGREGKIKILKEKSDAQISIENLRHAYSSIDKVYVYINEVTKEGITFTIIDRNEEYPYNYSSNDYSITTVVKNPKYGEIRYYDGDPMVNLIPSSYAEPEPEYIQKDITEEIDKESTVKTLIADSQDEISKFKATRKIITWKEFLGELKERKV